MTTLAEEHAGPDAGYYGDQGDWIILAARHRDSDVLDRANFLAAQARAERADIRTDISRSGHWAVGWVEYLITPPDYRGEELAAEIADDLERYPVLSDDLYSEMESDEARESVMFALVDHSREVPHGNDDPQWIEAVADTLAELDTGGHWTSDAAHEGCSLAIYSYHRGSEDRKDLAVAMRHVRHAPNLPIWNCEVCND